VQDKIFKEIEIIETIDKIPETYLKSIKGVKGLYEARILLASNIWRVFCLSKKTPRREITKVVKLMFEYFNEKKEKDGN
jgi:hypothetical protein